MDFSVLQKEHVFDAAEQWKTVRAKEGDWYKKFQRAGFRFQESKRYDVLIKGLPYPPKAICSIGYSLATGKEPLRTNELAGAQDGGWHRRLRELGFEIIEKSDKLEWASSIQDEFEMAVKKSETSASDERNARLSNAPKKPEQIIVKVVVYKRNPDVVAAVLERAGGVCEGCEKTAPFKRARDNKPYLEVHHKIRLADNGDDTVENAMALCPNCHRKAHFGTITI